MSELKRYGKVLHISPTESRGEKGFQVRWFALKVEDSKGYTQELKFELLQDNVTKADSFKVGDMIEVDFNLRGRSFLNKEGDTVYFNSLVCWKVAHGMAEPTEVDRATDDLPF